VVRVLNEQARPGDVAISAAGTLPADLLKSWDATGGRACHLEFGYSCMGYEIPASLGVRLAQPRGEVFALVGDGTYLMNPMELVTAVQEGLKITVVVSENHGFQCIRSLQLSRTGHAFGNEFRRRDPQSGRLEGEFLDIDFAGNAVSLGARAWRVGTPDELRQALQEARRVKGRPCVIVAEVEEYRFLPDSGAWIDFGVAEVSADPATRKLRREYERRQQRQRFHY
jgi:3D-(3,5/4)-trihydroxycyclohexane-1,2-dione acylhydrolase (decyclizing)